MSSRPWMPLYVDAFIMDTIDLSYAQVGAYVRLLLLAWRQPDGTLPNDMRWLKPRLGMQHGHTFNALIPPLLARYFRLNEEGRWAQKRLCLELQKSVKFNSKQRQNILKRWAKMNDFNPFVDTTVIPARATTITKKEYTASSQSDAAPQQAASDKASEGLSASPELQALLNRTRH